jgi:hypothetical protein
MTLVCGPFASVQFLRAIRYHMGPVEFTIAFCEGNGPTSPNDSLAFYFTTDPK